MSLFAAIRSLDMQHLQEVTARVLAADPLALFSHRSQLWALGTVVEG